MRQNLRPSVQPPAGPADCGGSIQGFGGGSKAKAHVAPASQLRPGDAGFGTVSGKKRFARRAACRTCMSYCSRRKSLISGSILFSRDQSRCRCLSRRSAACALDHVIPLVHRAEEAGVVGMARCRPSRSSCSGRKRRADRADILHRAGAVRPDDQRRLAMLRPAPAGGSRLSAHRLLEEAGLGIDRSERRQMVAEEDDDRRPLALLAPSRSAVSGCGRRRRMPSA